MVYGQLFPDASDTEMETLRTMGHRWKQYEKDGIWSYQQHAFWCTGYSPSRSLPSLRSEAGR